MPGFGYGINYDYGLFKQVIVDGYQKEKPDYWPNRKSPWLIRRTEERYMVPIYGQVEGSVDRDGEYNPVWSNWALLIGRPMIFWSQVSKAGPSTICGCSRLRHPRI